MLADMAAEMMAAKSLLYRVCWQAARGGADRKELHALAAAVKLLCSETAGRIIDRAVQISAAAATCASNRWSGSTASCASTGSGRARARSSALVIGNELRKRGHGAYTGWV